MSRSEPKPKIIYKNLEDLLKSNSLSKNNSKSNLTQRKNNHPVTQLLPTHPPSTMPSRKTNFISIIDNNQTEQLTSPEYYSICYNQIDAIFTQIEDFFCQSKEKVLQQLNGIMHNKNKQTKSRQNLSGKVEQLKKMSDYIKHITKFFIEGEVPEQLQLCHQSKQNRYSLSKTGKSNPITVVSTVGTQNYEDQSHKILGLSMKNSKVRANRRGQMINDRKKTIYQLILEEKQKKGRQQSKGKKVL